MYKAMANTTKAGLTLSIKNKIQIIQFNNPRKKNAIQVQAYFLIKEALENGAKDPEVSVTVLTGTGDYYSSGFDITDPDLQADRENAQKDLKEMIDAFINYPKLLVAVVNGPAIGLAVTTLGLCDIVYASDKAIFTTPFSKLGLCAEGCASYTFPKILGSSKANEMLLIGHKMTAEEALQFGFVSKIYKHTDLPKVWDRILEFKNVSAQSIQISKKMSRHFDRQNLLHANQMEIDNLEVCIKTEDFSNAVIKFLTRKSKL